MILARQMEELKIRRELERRRLQEERDLVTTNWLLDSSLSTCSPSPSIRLGGAEERQYRELDDQAALRRALERSMARSAMLESELEEVKVHMKQVMTEQTRLQQIISSYQQEASQPSPLALDRPASEEKNLSLIEDDVKKRDQPLNVMARYYVYVAKPRALFSEQQEHDTKVQVAQPAFVGQHDHDDDEDYDSDDYEDEEGTSEAARAALLRANSSSEEELRKDGGGDLSINSFLEGEMIYGTPHSLVSNGPSHQRSSFTN